MEVNASIRVLLIALLILFFTLFAVIFSVLLSEPPAKILPVIDPPEPTKAAAITKPTAYVTEKPDKPEAAITGIIPAKLAHLAPLILSEAEKYNLDPLFIISVIERESSYNPNAVNINNNGTTDRGLMQINSTMVTYLADSLGFPATEETAFDPVLNIKMGCYFLGELNQKFDGDLYLVATAYNAGERRALLGRSSYGTEVVNDYRNRKEALAGE